MPEGYSVLSLFPITKNASTDLYPLREVPTGDGNLGFVDPH
jgi:hypothetical protein